MMVQEIIGKDNYDLIFREKVVREKALEYALDIRKFEIELYWKRATYFWALIAVSFAGYFALVEMRHDKDGLPISEGYIFLITCIGLILSFGWYLVNRGSKYWQENWERHVDALEDSIIGPLYRTTISRGIYKWWGPSDGWPFSVSKINQLISLFITIIWFFLAVNSFPYSFPINITTFAKCIVLALVTIVFCFGMLKTGMRRECKGREIRFEKEDLTD